ncbi:MAG: succinate dehydrogenase, cytochrome b556 subunit [Chloroflexota bacterium]
MKQREGLISFWLHRVSGVAVMMFLIIHVGDTAFVMLGPAIYNRILDIYKSAWFQPLEVLLVAAVLFHALNGLKVIVLDFWDATILYQRQLTYAVAALCLAVMLPVTYIMLRPTFFGGA